MSGTLRVNTQFVCVFNGLNKATVNFGVISVCMFESINTWMRCELPPPFRLSHSIAVHVLPDFLLPRGRQKALRQAVEDPTQERTSGYSLHDLQPDARATFFRRVRLSSLKRLFWRAQEWEECSESEVRQMFSQVRSLSLLKKAILTLKKPGLLTHLKARGGGGGGGCGGFHHTPPPPPPSDLGCRAPENCVIWHVSVIVSQNFHTEIKAVFK